jgi:biopolymer transport protein ExbD
MRINDLTSFLNMIFSSKHFKTSVKIQKGVMDVTPLIDVVFQLIIFFLLSSSFVLQPGIKIELPETPVSSTGVKPSGLSVSILGDGRIFFNEKQIDLKELTQILKSERASNSEEALIIKADQKTHHGVVVEIMGIAKQVGIKRFAIATKPGFNREE